MDWKHIPSLSALRAFETTARLQNQTAAARELNVTHAAINQHIRALEAYFERALFERQGRGLALTPHGEKLYASVGAGFAEIREGVAGLLAPENPSRVRVAVTPFLYELWILPRIQDFWKKHPDIQLQFVASAELVDLKRDDFDLAIRFGNGKWPPFRSEFLFAKQSAVFGAKSYFDANPGIELSEAVWIYAKDTPEYDHFFREAGIDINAPQHKIFDNTYQAKAALLAGIGLFAHARQLLEQEVQFGLIEEIASFDLEADIGYYLLRKSGEDYPALARFVEWLKTQFANE